MEIIINRGKQVALSDLPPYSLALDGYVEGIEIDNENHRYSFDHHAKCYRFATLSACMQAHTAINLGLFSDNDQEKYTVYANDVDADVCAAYWCLSNPDRCDEPLVTKLIQAIGLGDMHGGAISCNGMSKTVEWICAPETDSKRNQDYHKLSNEGLKSILEAVLHRIDLYVNGEASIEVAKQPKHGEYKILRNENNWTLVESQDTHIAGVLYQAGFTRLCITRPQQDGSLAVSLAKKSDFIGGYPLFDLYQAFNQLEPGWGGSSSVGGCTRYPDGSRSKLTLSVIIETIDKILNKHE